MLVCQCLGGPYRDQMPLITCLKCSFLVPQAGISNGYATTTANNKDDKKTTTAVAA